jgi:hypothetical protein
VLIADGVLSSGRGAARKIKTAARITRIGNVSLRGTDGNWRFRGAASAALALWWRLLARRVNRVRRKRYQGRTRSAARGVSRVAAVIGRRADASVLASAALRRCHRA